MLLGDPDALLSVAEEGSLDGEPGVSEAEELCTGEAGGEAERAAEAPLASSTIASAPWRASRASLRMVSRR